MQRTFFPSLLVLSLFPQLAVAYEPIVPEDFDVAGIWVMDARAGFDEDIITRCDGQIYARQNFPMYGRTWMELRSSDAMLTEGEGARPIVVVRYEGTLHYFQGYGDIQLIDADTNRWRTNHYCAVEPLDYQLVGELRYDIIDGLISFSASGPVSTPIPYEHGSTGSASNARINFDPLSGPVLHLSYRGDTLLLYAGPSTPVNAGVRPEGCNATLTPGVQTVRLDNCMIDEGLPWIWRRRDSPPDVHAKGTITGTLIEGLPDGTDNNEPLAEGRVRLYDLPRGLRAQRANESNDDYARFIAAERGSWSLVAEAQPDTAGRFTLNDVPALRPGGSGRGLVRAVYALEVTGAKKDEVDPVDGVTETLQFLDARQTPVTVGDDVRVVMIPAAAIGVKTELAAGLNNLAPRQYGPVEEQVLAHLRDLQNGTIPVTPERLEGVKRAVWAERVVRLGTELAVQVIDIFVDLLAGYVSDAVSKKVSTERKDPKLKAASEKLEMLQESRSLAAARAAGFGASDAGFDAVNESIKKLLNQNPSLAELQQLELGKKIVGLAIKGLLAALTRAGFDTGSAEALASIIQDGLLVFAQAVATGERGPVYAQILKTLTANLKSTIFDNATPICYAGLTKSALELSRDRMIAWSTDDPTAYVADRTEVLNVMQLIADSGTTLLQGLAWTQGFSEGVGNAKDVYELVPIPAFQQAAQLSDKLKKGADLATFLSSAAYVFASLPITVQLGAEQAFGIRRQRSVALPNIGRTAPIGEAVRIEWAIAADDLRRALTAHRQALIRTELEVIISTLAGDSGSVLAAFEAYDRAIEAYLLQLSGALVDDPQLDYGVVPIATRYGLLRVELSELIREERDFLIRALSGDLQAYSSEYNAIQGRLNERFKSVDAGLFDLASGTTLPPDDAPVRPAVFVEPLRLRSLTTGLPGSSSANEHFAVETKVRSVSTATIGGLVAELRLHDTSGRVRIVGASQLAITGLAGNDQQAGGADEQTLSFELELTGDPLSLDDSLMSVRITGGAEAGAFTANEPITLLAPQPELRDVDADGMPDAFERAHGLDPTRDDSADDQDGDGLSNGAELYYYTAVDQVDSDGDTLSDGEELSAGADGFITDPLSADSDGDDLDDAADGAPNDGNGSTPESLPEPTVALSVTGEIVLTRRDPVQVIKVNNGGAGRLAWTVIPGGESPFVEISPQAPAIRGEGDYLVVRLNNAARSAWTGAERLSLALRVVDVSGVVPDEQVLAVALNEATQPGADGGAPGPDGSVGSDGGVGPGVDAGTAGIDGGPNGGGEGDEGGCGCRSHGASGGHPWFLAWVLLAWWGRSRTRRAPARPAHPRA